MKYVRIVMCLFVMFCAINSNAEDSKTTEYQKTSAVQMIKDVGRLENLRFTKVDLLSIPLRGMRDTIDNASDLVFSYTVPKGYGRSMNTVVFDDKIITELRRDTIYYFRQIWGGGLSGVIKMEKENILINLEYSDFATEMTYEGIIAISGTLIIGTSINGVLQHKSKTVLNGTQYEYKININYDEVQTDCHGCPVGGMVEIEAEKIETSGSNKNTTSNFGRIGIKYGPKCGDATTIYNK